MRKSYTNICRGGCESEEEEDGSIAAAAAAGFFPELSSSSANTRLSASKILPKPWRLDGALSSGKPLSSVKPSMFVAPFKSTALISALDGVRRFAFVRAPVG